jgi:hypothetical protein
MSIRYFIFCRGTGSEPIPRCIFTHRREYTLTHIINITPVFVNIKCYFANKKENRASARFSQTSILNNRFLLRSRSGTVCQNQDNPE